MADDTGTGTGEGGGSEGKADASGGTGSGDASSPVQSQIADMLGTFLDDKASDKEFEDVTKGIDEATDEVGKGISEEGKDSSAVEDTAKKDIAKAEVTTDGEGEKEGAAKDDRIAQLEQQLTSLSQQISALLNSQTGKEPAKPTEPGEDPLVKEELETAKKDLVSEFIQDDAEYDSAFDKREKMNEILARVQQTTLQASLRSIPRIINKIVPQYVQLYQKSIDFYSKNEDLKPHAKFVGEVTNDIVGKHPDWNIDQVFTELGTEARKRLGLKKTAESTAKKENVSRPAFGKAQSARQGGDAAVKLTGVAKEIDDMLSTEEL